MSTAEYLPSGSRPRKPESRVRAADTDAKIRIQEAYFPIRSQGCDRYTSRLSSLLGNLMVCPNNIAPRIASIDSNAVRGYKPIATKNCSVQ
jgi:hypothetical protein